MNIGAKIKQARIDAQLTQEQVAEALGVSRQTVSNWENEKTYPDIISVIKLSDLYAVSLDHLLKEQEEKNMSDYMNYLEETTNTVKCKNRLSRTVITATYLAIWAFSVIMFWCFGGRGDAMGYSLIVLWCILPITTLIISLAIGRQRMSIPWRVTLALVLGVMYMLAEYATFLLANTLAFGHINMPSWA